MDIPGLVEYTNLRPLDQHIVYVPFYMPGEHPNSRNRTQAFLDKVRRYLKKINPALNDDDFLDMRASRYRYAQPICEPGYLDRLPPSRCPVGPVGGRYVVLLSGGPRHLREHRFRSQDGAGCSAVIRLFMSRQFLTFLVTGGIAAAVNFGSRILL